MTDAELAALKAAMEAAAKAAVEARTAYEQALCSRHPFQPGDVIRTKYGETTRKEAWVPKVGDRVRINEGPYEGIEATIVKLHGDSALLDMGDVETDSHYGKHRWMFSRVRLRVSLVLPCAPDPTPSPALAAAREAVVQAAMKQLDEHDRAHGGWTTSWSAMADATEDAARTLRALLTPPPPPPPPDPVAEARAAFAALDEALPSAPGPLMDRLRSALAAMEART